VEKKGELNLILGQHILSAIKLEEIYSEIEIKKIELYSKFVYIKKINNIII